MSQVDREVPQNRYKIPTDKECKNKDLKTWIVQRTVYGAAPQYTIEPHTDKECKNKDLETWIVQRTVYGAAPQYTIEPHNVQEVTEEMTHTNYKK